MDALVLERVVVRMLVRMGRGRGMALAVVERDGRGAARRRGRGRRRRRRQAAVGGHQRQVLQPVVDGDAVAVHHVEARSDSAAVAFPASSQVRPGRTLVDAFRRASFSRPETNQNQKRIKFLR